MKRHRLRSCVDPVLFAFVLSFILVSNSDRAVAQVSPTRPGGSVVDVSNPLTANLTGLFVMNEGSGSTDKNLVDGQSASFSGSLPTWNTNDPSIVFQGGSALNSYVNAGTDLGFDRLTPGKMTIVAKVYVNTIANAGIAEKNDGDTIDSGFMFGWNSAGALSLRVEKYVWDMTVTSNSNAVAAGQWMQVAFTWDGTVGNASAAHLFVNGVEQSKASFTDGSGTIGYGNATNQPFRIGSASINLPGSLNGKMAYMAVYRGRILTTAEMGQLDSQLPLITNLATGTIAESGAAATITTTQAGENAQLTFTGWQGQQVTVQLSNNTMGAVTVGLYNPDASLATSASSSASSFNLPAVTLSQSGQYYIVIHPTGATSGSITASLAVQGGLRLSGSGLDPTNALFSNLVGLFIMNEGSGTTDLNLVDWQTASLSGSSAPTWNTADPSIVFNGGNSLNSYVNAGADLTFDWLPISKVTVVGKVYLNAMAAAGVAEKNDGDTIDSGFVFGWDGTGALRLIVEKSAVDMKVASSSNAVTAGQWQQVAFTWDGTAGNAAAAHLFINGVEQTKASSQDGSGTLGYANATSQPFRIGNASFGFAGSLNGKMAYLAVYRDRILTTTELNQLDLQLPINTLGLMPPTVSMTSPINNSTVYLSSPVTLSASPTVTNSGATISKVQYFDGRTLLGQVSSSPYSLTLSSLPATGNHTYTAVATDSYGMTGQSARVTATLSNPKITSVTPDHGTAGTKVAIHGVGFGTSAAGVVASFNGVPGFFTGFSDSEMDVIVPSGAGNGMMGVSWPDGDNADGAPPFGPCSGWCVSGFSVSASMIPGDGSTGATGTVSMSGPSGVNPPYWSAYNNAGGWGQTFQCVSPATYWAGQGAGCNSPNAGFSFLLGPTITSSTSVQFLHSFSAMGGNDPGLWAQITIVGTGQANGSTEMGPCKDCAVAGKPINLKTGNAYIQQQDYALPGLGGGISLARTWNSQWASTFPLTRAGMFGDSWRGTYEDRIQATPSGNVNYWLDGGEVWRFAYNSGTYSINSPVDAHASLSYNSTTQQYTVTFVSGDKKIFNFSGYLIQVVDRNGNTSVLTYDGSNRLTQVTDAAGRTLTFAYGDSNNPNQVTSITDATGAIATYSYGTSSRLTNVTYADNSQLNYTYDSNGLITNVTDALGKVLEAHTYDSQRRGLTSQRANGVEQVSVSYPQVGFSVTLDSAGNSSNYAYSQIGEKNFIGTVSGPGCASCGIRGFNQYTYDANGNVTAAFDSNGVPTLYTYDGNGNVTSSAIPLNNHLVTWQYSYNSFGELLTATDPLGNVTTNTYDANGNLLTITTPAPDGQTAASVTTFAYDSKGQLTSITDPLNHATTLAYYSTGLLHTITDALNDVTTFAYDQRGNRTDVYDALNNHTAFTYDARNRLTKITNPDTSTVNFAYDTRGRRTSVTDGNGKVTQYAYDDADRLATVTDANNHVTQYAYDLESNLTSITDANNHTTSFAYDKQGHLTKTTFPSTKVETYTYDNVGNLMTKIDRKNQVISYAYDTLYRLVSKTYPDSSSVTYTYDDADRLTQVQDATGTYSFLFDNVGRPKQTTTAYSFVSGNPFTIVYGYDKASNRTSMTDPNNGQTTYTYDTLNRLTNILDFNNNNFGLSYDPLSRRKQLTRPNGINTNYSYDSMSDLLSILHQQGASTLDGANYTYDSAGNRTSKTNRLNGAVSNFSYDNIYQLTEVTGPNPESYTYDPVGNRLMSQSVSNYAYNSSNELTMAGSASYTYDDNGNTKTKTDSTGTATYTWDFENRLTSVQLPNGSTVNFKYDPFGRRIQKSGATVTNYVYDGAKVIEEVDSSTNLLARYSQGAGIDEPLSELRSGAISYYEQDGLGSVISLSNVGGAVANTYVYDSFGNLTSSGGTVTNPYQYTGRDYDLETGLRYYRARYYDSSTGRFLNEDPLAFEAGINFYSYAENSPTNEIDPFGLQRALPKPAPGPQPVPRPGPRLVPSPPPTAEPGNPTGPIAFCVANPEICLAILYLFSPGQQTVNGVPAYCYDELYPQNCPNSRPLPQPKPDQACKRKSKQECDARQRQEESFCLEEYKHYPNLLHKCMERAEWRWNNCLRGLPDPGPLDPLDPKWSPN